MNRVSPNDESVWHTMRPLPITQPKRTLKDIDKEMKEVRGSPWAGGSLYTKGMLFYRNKKILYKHRNKRGLRK